MSHARKIVSPIPVSGYWGKEWRKKGYDLCVWNNRFINLKQSVRKRSQWKKPRFVLEIGMANIWNDELSTGKNLNSTHNKRPNPEVCGLKSYLMLLHGVLLAKEISTGRCFVWES